MYELFCKVPCDQIQKPKLHPAQSGEVSSLKLGAAVTDLHVGANQADTDGAGKEWHANITRKRKSGAPRETSAFVSSQ